MIVARQFIAWNTSIENPSRRARSDPLPQLINRPNRGTPIGCNHTVPTGRVAFFDTFQAINCLATIICPSGTKSNDRFGTGRVIQHNQAINCLATLIWSLRDKVRVTPRHPHRSKPYPPLFEKLTRDLSQKPGRTLYPLLGVTVWPDGGVKKIELVFSPGDRHIKKAPLFLDILIRF